MQLTNENIDDVIKKIEKFFESLKVSKKDIIKICFLLEESLLRFQEKFGEDYEFDFVTKKWFGTPKVLIRVKGSPYNPIEDDSDEQIFSQNIMQNLMIYEGAGTVYRYENGCNEIVAYLTTNLRNFKIPGGAFTILISLAIFLGFLISNFPQPIQDFIVYDFLTPILNTLIGTLIAINMPLIFISIVASICSIENIAMLHDVGSKIMLRFMAMMFFFAFMSILVCAIFFPVIDLGAEKDLSSTGAVAINQLFELILSMFPQDVFMAFVNKNILQVMVLAFVMGICVTILGDRVRGFKNLIMDLKQITFKLIGIVFKLIPAVVFMLIVKAIIVYSAAEILAVWKVIIVKYILFLAISFIMLLRISTKYGVKILDFLKKIYPAIVISFKTGGGIAALPKNLEVCKKELKVDENLCDFYIPLSHTLCSSTLVIEIVVSIFFAAEFSGQKISFAEIFMIAFLAVQFAISAVGGNGGMVGTLSLLLTQMEFSLDAIGPVTVAGIFTVNFAIVTALIIRDCDLFDVSHKIKLSEQK